MGRAQLLARVEPPARLRPRCPCSAERVRLYDDLVIVESIVGEQQLAEADDVARYEKYVELLRDAASTGAEAATVIRQSLESLQ